MWDMVVGVGKKTIEASKFYFSNSLKEVVISEDVERIEDWAFGYCSNLVKIVISKNVSYISSCAFDGCEKLERIDVDENNSFYSSVEGILYSKDYTTLIRVPSNHKSEDFFIHDSVIKLEKLSFSRCRNLKTVHFSKSLEEIGEKAFSYCKNIQTFLLPDTVTKIGNYAFADCYSLETININNSYFYSENDILYEIQNGKKTLIQYPLGKKDEEYVIGKEIVCVKDRAFIGAKALQNIHVINNAFYCSRDGIVYESGFRRLICFPTQKKIKEFLVPNEVEVIGNSSLKMNCHIEHIVFSRQLRLIERHAIEDCALLKKITLSGENLRKIEWSAFWGCKELREIDLSNQKELYIDSLAFSGCDMLSRVRLPKNCVLGRGVFKDCREIEGNAYE